MGNEKIKLGTAMPLLSAMAGRGRIYPDSFTVARRLHAAIWVFDIDNSRIIFANDTACHLWQAENEEVLCNRNLADDMSSTVAKRLKQYQIDFVAHNAVFDELWTLYPKGKPESVRVYFSGFCLPDGRMAMLCEAVSQVKDEPEKLRTAEALLHTDVMITLFEKDGAPFYMNPAARNAAFDPTLKFEDHFVYLPDYDTLIDNAETSGQHRMVARVRTNSGPRWYDISAKLCSDSVTGKPAILVTAVDVSELKNARDKARYLADRDQLTGCFNRTYLLQHVAAIQRSKTGRCALLCFDLDNFKQINDRLGHQMGDVVLKEVAARANKSIRECDILVRLGGDEFVIIFEDIAIGTEFSSRIENLLKLIAQPITHQSVRTTVTVSMGVTMFSPDTADLTNVMREADIAQYASKQAGRNRVTFFTEQMGSAANARNTIEQELKTSMENRNFVLHFQPRVDLAESRVVSAEALVRWQHPERGLIMPNEFIPICEETGMIEELGQLVLEMGCEQAIAWHKSGFDIEISLNISPRQFDDERLMQSLRKYSVHPEFPSEKIELEITENVLIGDHDHIENKLEAIAQLGYRIAIDDFGTGYSNLSYISRFPLNCLKIDQSFINQLPKSGPIIDLILTLARQIGATVVAEGVETAEHLDWLADHDCEQVQGYLLSRPVPLERLESTVEQLNAKCKSNALNADTRFTG